jgi:hypothetical protein
VNAIPAGCSPFDYLRHFEISCAARGSIGKRVAIAQRSVRHVLAQSGRLIRRVENLRHRFHVRGIELVELFDVCQDMTEVLRHAMHFFLGEPQIRKIRNITDLFFTQFQAIPSGVPSLPSAKKVGSDLGNNNSQDRMSPFQFYLAIAAAPVATMLTVLVGILVNNSTMNAHVRRLDEKIDTQFSRLDDKIDARSEVLETHLRRVEDMLLGKFAELDNRLTRIEAHLNLQ